MYRVLVGSNDQVIFEIKASCIFLSSVLGEIKDDTIEIAFRRAYKCSFKYLALILDKSWINTLYHKYSHRRYVWKRVFVYQNTCLK